MKTRFITQGNTLQNIAEEMRERGIEIGTVGDIAVLSERDRTIIKEIASKYGLAGEVPAEVNIAA